MSNSDRILTLGRQWREEKGVIRFTVTSDGTSGSAWIDRLEKAGYRVYDAAKSVLRSPDFHSTSGITYEVVVLKGALFGEMERLTPNIRAEAARRRFATPNAELACLIRWIFGDDDLKAMGLYWLAVMHEPIGDSSGDVSILAVGRGGEGRCLNAYADGPGFWWTIATGLAFVVLPTGR